jgi:hypothetical protein
MSPDEDFVETYKLRVLTDPPSALTSVDITVPGFGTAHIVTDLQNRVELKNKMACVVVDF